MALTVTYELALRRDIQPIAAMSRNLIEAGLHWRWTPSRVAARLRCPDTLVLVARLPGSTPIAGFAIMHFEFEDAHLLLLAVEPSRRRRGIGRGLMAWLEKSARTAGIARVHLEVRAANREAQLFYRALGFSETRYIPRYYEGREAAVGMVNRLRVSA